MSGAHGPRYKPIDYVVSSLSYQTSRYIAALYAKGIRCNAIAPHGVVDGHSKSFRIVFMKLSPMGRMCGETN